MKEINMLGLLPGCLRLRRYVIPGLLLALGSTQSLMMNDVFAKELVQDDEISVQDEHLEESEDVGAGKEDDDELKPLAEHFNYQLTLGYNYLKRFYNTSDARYLERHSTSIQFQKMLPFQFDGISGMSVISRVWFQQFVDNSLRSYQFYPSFIGLHATLASDNDFMHSAASVSLRYYLPLDADEREYEEYRGAPSLGFRMMSRNPTFFKWWI